ncbi:MAG TPA: hypothetical protein VNK89_00770 [Thermoflexus sp.]|nr:hypothetical protein [Thermoflexus sp.]
MEAVAKLAVEQGWEFPYNLNKYYVGFKLGNKPVFSVGWGGTYAWNLRLKLPEDTARSFRGQSWALQRYDRDFREAIFQPLNPDAPDFSELKSLLIEAYQYVSGQQITEGRASRLQDAGKTGRGSKLEREA